MTHPAPVLDYAASTKPTKTPRDYRIDFFRGVALLAITINHTVQPLHWNKTWTHEVGQFFGFNFADVFVFLSGLVCAYAYSRVFDREGLLATEIKAAKRCAQIYVAAMISFVLTLLFILLISRWPHKVAFLNFDLGALKTANGVGRALLISGPYNHFAILKFYIVLLAVMPLGLLVYRTNRWLLLGLTAAVWLGINVAFYSHRVGPHFGAGPFGNYYAWQFLFFGGLWIGLERKAGRLRVNMTAGRVIGLVAFLLLMQYFRQVQWIVPKLDEREHLGPVRIVELLAVVLIIGHVIPPQASFFTHGVADMIRRLGTRSLTIFAASIFLCYVGTHTAALLHASRGLFLLILIVEVLLLMVFSNVLDRRALKDVLKDLDASPAAPSQAAPSAVS